MADVRKVETGVDHEGKPTYEYQFGAKIDGAFVPFVTKSAGYVEGLAANEKARQEADADADDDDDDDEF